MDHYLNYGECAAKKEPVSFFLYFYQGGLMLSEELWTIVVCLLIVQS